MTNKENHTITEQKYDQWILKLKNAVNALSGTRLPGMEIGEASELCGQVHKVALLINEVRTEIENVKTIKRLEDDGN